MYVSTISFYSSFILMTLMIVLKYREMKAGKRSWLSFLAQKTDHIVYKSYRNIRQFIMYINKKSAIALAQWIAYHILSWVRSLYIWIRTKAHAYPHTKRVIDMVRGKGTVKKNNGASFYLKKISKE